MANYFDDSVSLGQRSMSLITDRPEGWTEGVVHTPAGTVQVYAQGSAQESYHTQLHFAWEGRLYTRNFPKRRFSQRGLVTAAHRFAMDVVFDEGKQ